MYYVFSHPTKLYRYSINFQKFLFKFFSLNNPCFLTREMNKNYYKKELLLIQRKESTLVMLS